MGCASSSDNVTAIDKVIPPPISPQPAPNSVKRDSLPVPQLVIVTPKADAAGTFFKADAPVETPRTTAARTRAAELMTASYMNQMNSEIAKLPALPKLDPANASIKVRGK